MKTKYQAWIKEYAVFLIILIGYLCGTKQYSVSLFQTLVSQACIWIPACLGYMLIRMSGGINIAVGVQIIFEASLMLHLKLFYNLDLWQLILINVAAGALIGHVFCFMDYFLGARVEITGIALYMILEGLRAVMYPLDTAYKSHILYEWNNSSLIVINLVDFFLLAAVFLFLNYTLPGRRIWAVGRYEGLVSSTGANVRGMKYPVYVIGCILIGISGCLLGFRTAIPTDYDPIAYTMYALATLTIGGSLNISRKNIIQKTIKGCLGLALVNGINYFMGMSAKASALVVGFIILIAGIMGKEE
jgi:ribose/xylose/arabinose/galactoside ABC-type transport system permease subunit